MIAQAMPCGVSYRADRPCAMYQETSLFEQMTVLENMFVGHEPRRQAGPFKVIDYAAERARASEILELLESDLDLNQKISELGMAKKQMVEIAKALTFDAKILILDEPTASLTQREVDALFSVIRKLKARGIAIAYISHRLEEIFLICDRVTVIRDGKYISTNEVSQTNKDRLVADMTGTIIATMIIAVLNSGLTVLNIPIDVQTIVQGTVLLISLVAYAVIEKRNTTSGKKDKSPKTVKAA